MKKLLLVIAVVLTLVGATACGKQESNSYKVILDYDTLVNSYDLDLMAVELTSEEIVRQAEDFVFYNIQESGDKSIKLSLDDGHQELEIDTNSVDGKIQKVVILAALYKNTEMEVINKASLTVKEGNNKIEDFELDIQNNLEANSIILIEFARNKNNTWSYMRNIEYAEDTIVDILDKYGIEGSYK